MFSATIERRRSRRWRGGSSATRCGIDLGGGARASSCRRWRWRRRDREAAVVNLLRLHEARAAIVFCGRREAAGQLAGRLAARGFAVAALSGALSQARAERGAGGDARGAGAGLRRDRPRGAGVRPAGARPGAARRPAGERRDAAASLRADRAGRARRAGGAGGDAGGAAAGGGAGGAGGPRGSPGCRRRTGPTIAARDLERMLAEAAGVRAGRARTPRRRRGFWPRMGAERIAAAYRRLWASARPAAGDADRAAG